MPSQIWLLIASAFCWLDGQTTSSPVLRCSKNDESSMAFPMASTLCDVASGVNDLDHIASALCKMR